MNVKNLKLAKNVAWGLAFITMFLLVLGNEQNNILNIVTFLLITTGIVFSYLHDKKI